MKQLLSILFIGLVLTTCQKSDTDFRDQYVGNWDFEVVYSSELNDSIHETVVNCQGKVTKGRKNSLKLQHCINDYLSIVIDEDGVVRSLNKELMGVIDSETCLIVDDHPKESSISKITIKGIK